MIVLSVTLAIVLHVVKVVLVIVHSALLVMTVQSVASVVKIVQNVALVAKTVQIVVRKKNFSIVNQVIVVAKTTVNSQK
ncbi:hypothetical protein [Acinetobacter soli]|uniref:hypothetical protein n=1 Tax=Acinetobacter soli TaxID=487316 RepID=UPI0026DF956C|nr:hypothetical protein [Acinetobacter soli]